MKGNIFTTAIISIGLLCSPLTMLGSDSSRRNHEPHRTEAPRPGNNKPGNRPGNNKPGNRPGNNGFRPGHHPGPGHQVGRPTPPPPHHVGRPTPPPPHHVGRPTPPPPPPHHSSWRPMPHPVYHGYRTRPAFGVNVSLGGINLFYSNGLYYNHYSGDRYMVTLPPVGMVVNTLFNPVYRYISDGYYYVSEGVIYRAIATPSGIGYMVVNYIN